ncbi:SusC/RagA family TonB-linked outer membrane protein [Pedobacter sp. NJ-S-72]
MTVKGTNIGTSSDASGNYLINASEKSVLIFSSTAYLRKEVPVNGNSKINVQLNTDQKALDEIVVVGYGVQKKATVTGSVATLKGDALRESPAANLTNAIAGRVPGVISTNRSGEPGSDFSTLLIRGMGTLNDNSPLIVIDGVANRGAFERMNPDDIESISVLKDASAAIYGAQSANGVILITTKRGKTGKPVITYNGSYGYTQPTTLPKLVNAGQYATYINEVNDRLGQPHQYSAADIQKYTAGSDPLNFPNTNWYHEVVKDFSPQYRHALTLSGGNDKFDHFISGEYLNQDGIFRNSATGYKQYNLRSNVTARVTSDLKVSLNLSERIEDRRYSNYDSGTIFAELLSAYPTLPAYYPNGLPGPGLAGGRNPVLMASGATGYNKIKDYSLQSDLSFDLKLPYVTKGLSISGLAAFDFRFNNGKKLYDNWDAYRYNPSTNNYDNLRNTEGPINLNENFRNYQLQTYNLKLGYERRFGDHNVNAFVAYEQSSNYNEGISAYRTGFLSSKIDQIFIGSDIDKDNGSVAGQSARQNLFGRLTYSFKDRYLAEFILRHDGSFNFPKGKQWGTFPALSVGWRISEENFFKNNVSFVNQLKLKASWGKLGNDKIDPYQNLQQYYLDNGYYFGANGDRQQGLSAGVAPNPGITWEVANTSNIGLESSFFHGDLSVNADYFISKRSNILTARNASVPSSTGLTGKLPAENIGKVNNKGIELEVFYKHSLNQDFSYSIGGNFTHTKNEVVFMDEAANVPDWQKVQGHPMDSWLVYKSEGIYRTQAEIDNSVHLPNTKPGDIRYADVDGDKKISSNDMVRAFDSPTPSTVFALNFGIYNIKG